MAFSRFKTGVMLRIAALLFFMLVLAWTATQTHWYVTVTLLVTIVVFQVMLLLRYVSHTSHEIARFLDTITFDDATANFASSADAGFAELGSAMNRVLERLRVGRMQREEQVQYFQSLISHVPIALISVGDDASVQLLNHVARHLFQGTCNNIAQLSSFGEQFAAGIEQLTPGVTAILRMNRPSGALQLKAAATDIRINGVRQRLISLQNIESELSAQELAAWQSVIRVMTHEVMNSLTPISSLALTAQNLVADVVAKSESNNESDLAILHDIQEALETLTRRSQGLLHFVQNHRRLTKPLLAKTEAASVRRIFARLQRLLAEELKNRHIMLETIVTPETLELSVDVELLDQALINMMRNAVEALKDTEQARIALTAFGDEAGRAIVAVADNGPGIPIDLREKVFVPFYTTKRQGSGVGLTLVRQIAMVHNASVRISETPGGGATISLLF